LIVKLPNKLDVVGKNTNEDGLLVAIEEFTIGITDRTEDGALDS